MPQGASWVRIEGSGLAYQGRCLLYGILFWPDSDADHVDVYDGLDATSGKKFVRLETSTSITWCHCFSRPVEFSSGIYVKDIDEGTETTVLFEPLEL